MKKESLKEPVYNPRTELGIGLFDELVEKSDIVSNGDKKILDGKLYQFTNGALSICGHPIYEDIPGDYISVNTYNLYNGTLVVIKDAEQNKITSFKIDIDPLPEVGKGYHASYKSNSEEKLVSREDNSSDELISADDEAACDLEFSPIRYSPINFNCTP